MPCVSSIDAYGGFCAQLDQTKQELEMSRLEAANAAAEAEAAKASAGSGGGVDPVEVCFFFAPLRGAMTDTESRSWLALRPRRTSWWRRLRR